MEYKGTIAYCAIPRIGGLYAHCRTLREVLAPYGWKVLAISAGARHCRLWQKEFSEEGCFLIKGHSEDEKDLAVAALEFCVAESVDIVFMTAPSDSLPIWNMIRHAPKRLKAVSRTYADTPFCYGASTLHSDRLSAVVANSHRQYQALKSLKRVDESRIKLIPHSVGMEYLDKIWESRSKAEKVRLGFCGRLIDMEKGIFRLPAVLARLERFGIPWKLDIFGDGPDEQGLVRRFERKGVAGPVRFHGRVSRDAMPGLLDEIDVILGTSYHEGFGIAVIEAMARGAVPIVFRIRGVTDWIVEHGRSGFVVEQGDVRGMANAIMMLHSNRGMLQRMRMEAKRAVERRFNPERMADAYDVLFTDVLREKFDVPEVPWNEFAAIRFRRSFVKRIMHTILPCSLKGKVGSLSRRVLR